MYSFYLVSSAFLDCFIFRVRKERDHFPLKVEFRATAKPAGGFPGSVLRIHHRGPGWEPFLAPTEFLTREHNTLSGKSFAKSKAGSYSGDLIRTMKGFLFLKACFTFLQDHSPSVPLQQELYRALVLLASCCLECPSPFFCLRIPHWAPNLGSSAATS